MSAAPSSVASNADSQPYWDAARQGRLVFRKCSDCGHVQFPPRALCPKCWSAKSEWTTHSGEGLIHSFSIVHRAPTPAYAGMTPYVLAVVDLTDGPRMISNIVGDDALKAGIGDRVSVTFESRDGGALPQFRRAAG